MLLSMVVAAVPVGATTVQNAGLVGQSSGGTIVMPDLPDKGVTNPATGASSITEPTKPTKPTYKEATLGNYMANSSAQKKADYLAEINAALKKTTGDPNAEYIPVVNSKREGVPTNAVLFTEINDDGHYYLWENITWNRTRGADGDPINGSGEGEDAEKFSAIGADPKIYIDDTVIDGCGHTITMTSNDLFLRTYNITLKNVTVKRDTVIDNNNSKFLHILQRWESRGYTKVYNLTIDVDYNITANGDNSKATGTLVYKAGSGSVIDNVLNTSTITLETGVAKMDQIGGLIGVTEGTVSVRNVVNKGSIVIKSTALDRTSGIGGIVGAAWGATSFENCFNEMSITVNNGAVLVSGAPIGGIVGKASNATTFTGCVNSGNITVGESDKAAFTPNVTGIGGIAGIIDSGNTDQIDKCFNEGNIDIKNGVVLGSGAPIGGIVGSASSTNSFSSCVNSGNITIGESGKATFTPNITGLGGIVGIIASGCTKNIDKCFNEGNIDIKNGVVLGDINIGGIVNELQSKMTLTNCVNSGSITIGEGTGTDFDPKIKSIGGITGAAVGSAVIDSDINANDYTIDNCFNKGKIWIRSDVAVVAAADVDIKQGVAGIVGRVSGTAAIRNCVSTADIISEGRVLRCFAGIVGAGQGSVLSINNCINGVAKTGVTEGDTATVDGDIKVFWKGSPIGDSASAGGILGYQYVSNASRVAIYNCTNNGNIVDLTTDKPESDKDRLMKAGIAAVIRGVKDVTFYNCVNNGNVVAGAINSSNSHSAGVLGYYGSLGNWMGNKTTDSTLTFDRCTNNGAISGRTNTGGILSGTTELVDQGSNGIVHYLTFIDCLNSGIVTRLGGGTGGTGGGTGGGIAGDITADSKLSVVFERCENANTVTSTGSTGGIVGSLNTSSAIYAPRYSFVGCENTGAITGGSQVGGISGYVNTSATNTDGVDDDNDYVPGLTLDGCINNAAITGTGTKVSGIVAWTDGDDGTTTSIKNCYNGQNGTVASGDPIKAGILSVANRKTDFENCYNLAVITNDNDGGYTAGICAKVDKDSTFTSCHNYGEVTSSGTDCVGIGGIVGGAQGAGNSVTLTDCVNNGEVELGEQGASLGVGGILGTVYEGDATLSYCHNAAPVQNSSTVERAENTGTGGLVGYVIGSGKTISVSYCENSADIVGVPANRLYAGGIIGCVNGGDYTATLNYCINSGAVSGGQYSAGAIAFLRTDNAPATYESTITNCVNSGAVTATSAAAGMLAYCLLDGDVKVAAVDITGCVNSGAISGTTYSGGMTAAQESGAEITYTIENCVSLGSWISANANSMSNSTISRCIVSGSEEIAPEGFTISGDSNTYEADSAELEDALDTKGVLTYKRENIKAIYAAAAKVGDSSLVYGEMAEEFDTARSTAKTYAVLVADNEQYFTAPQSTTDLAYQTLYDIMYGYDPAHFTVYIPEAIALEEKQTITTIVDNFSVISRLNINVSGDFTLRMAEDDNVYVKYYLEKEGGEKVDASGPLFTVDEGNADALYHSFTPRVDRDNSKAVPGEYSGKITFAIQYVQKDIEA